MFCRFGSLLLKRPVAATAWLKQVCTRPVSRIDELRQRVDVGALQLLQRAPLENQPRQIVRERQLLEHLDGRRRRLGLDVPLRAPAAAACRTGSRDSCFGELMLNGSPASSKICALRVGQLPLDVLRLRGERRGSRCARRRARSPPAPESAAARAPRRRASSRFGGEQRRRAGRRSCSARSARSPA